MKSRIYIVIVLSVLVFSCGKSKDEASVLPRQKFTSLLIRMHLLEADYSFDQQLDQKAVDRTYTKYETLFKQFATDSATVSRTFDHYADKQEELLEIYRQVLDSLNMMALKEQPKKTNPVK